MKQMRKRLCAMALVLVFILGALPMAASAAPTPVDPYERFVGKWGHLSKSAILFYEIAYNRASDKSKFVEYKGKNSTRTIYGKSIFDMWKNL